MRPNIRSIRSWWYISLKTQLQADEVFGCRLQLSTYSDGKTYQVGEFSTDNPSSAASCLYVKLLKGITMSPDMPFWDLMMKNIYSLGAYSVQKVEVQVEYHVSKRYKPVRMSTICRKGDCQPNLVTSAEPG